LYERNECLWNVTSKDYKNAPKKKAARVTSVPNLGEGAKGATAPGIHIKGAPTQVVEHLKNIIHLAHTFISMVFFIV